MCYMQMAGQARQDLFGAAIAAMIRGARMTASCGGAEIDRDAWSWGMAGSPEKCVAEA